MTRWKTLVTDEITCRTNQPHVFAGGDCVTGPATLIGALAAGKNAARFIGQYLASGKSVPEESDYTERLIAQLGVFYYKEKMPYAGNTRKLHAPVPAAEVRTRSFEEVEGKVSPACAVKEAARCLRCYRIAMAAI